MKEKIKKPDNDPKEMIEAKDLSVMKEDLENIKSNKKLASLINHGTFEQPIDSIKDNKLIMKVLSSKEREFAYALSELDDYSPEDLKKLDEDKQFKIIKDQYGRVKCGILAYSIVSINGQVLEEIATKQEVYEQLRNETSIFSDILYVEFQKIQNEYFESISNLENFKKKQKKVPKT